MVVLQFWWIPWTMLSSVSLVPGDTLFGGAVTVVWVWKPQVRLTPKTFAQSLTVATGVRMGWGMMGRCASSPIHTAPATSRTLQQHGHVHNLRHRKICSDTVQLRIWDPVLVLTLLQLCLRFLSRSSFWHSLYGQTLLQLLCTSSVAILL